MDTWNISLLIEILLDSGKVVIDSLHHLPLILYIIPFNQVPEKNDIRCDLPDSDTLQKMFSQWSIQDVPLLLLINCTIEIIEQTVTWNNPSAVFAIPSLLAMVRGNPFIPSYLIQFDSISVASLFEAYDLDEGSSCKMDK